LFSLFYIIPVFPIYQEVNPYSIPHRPPLVKGGDGGFVIANEVKQSNF